MTNNSASQGQTLQEFIKISTLLAKERNLHRLLTHVVESSKTLIGAQAGMVWLLDATKRNLYVETYLGKVALSRPDEISAISLYEAQKHTESNIVAYAAVSGKLINVKNIYEYTGFHFDAQYQLDKLLNVSTGPCLTVPLVDYNGLTVGVMQLMNTNQGVSFSKDHEGLVKALGCQAAVAIENVKLFEENKLLIKALDESNRKLRQENKQLLNRIQGHYDFGRIVGDSEPLKKVLEMIKKVLKSDATVLILGETGTGKELIAHSIHYNSNRREKQFVTQNCAALPENLLESELFGYKKGAFSGANSDKKGLIELADGGTLFLDEVGDMPLGLQAKILRILQEKEVRPLGGTVARKVNVRIVAATHHDLEAKVRQGEFREDLYYRLTVFPITVPALRARRDDIPALVNHFIQDIAEKYEKEIVGISPMVLNQLMRYDYPGNIRELRNMIERAILLAEEGGHILPEHLDDNMARKMLATAVDTSQDSSLAVEGRLKGLLENYESKVIRYQLERNKWNQTQTADALGVSRRTLIDKMARYKISTSMGKNSIA